MPKRQDPSCTTAGDALPVRGRVGAVASTRATPARKRFDSLIKRLERARAQLHAWQDALPRWEQRFHEQVDPLLRERDAAQGQLLRELDAAHAAYKLSKRDRADLSECICELAALLIEDGDNDALKDIYDRHSPIGFEQGQAESEALLKSVVGEEFGLTEEELAHIQSPEALYAQVQERLHAQQAHAAGRAQQRDRRRRAGAGKATQVAADPQQARRALYRNLVAALHPDREPDPQQRARKTALMQRLNQAYQDDDLLALLELQLEIGQLDQAGIAAMAEERIRDYNSLFATQLQQVEQTLAGLVDDFMGRYGLYDGRAPQPQRLDALLAQIKRQVQEEIRSCADDRAAVRSADTLKQWLKRERERARLAEQELDDAMYDAMLLDQRW
ncbi:J domain-containing protein [Xanthomonas rydalmerensis]|uniref:J domain-containing protein n=1 Tax=Xanthomonas rydalmerensis TaxID=3046274 RepID=A0ABZ0JII6_9XANT|nr:J domain-containing protein [Xanthomonas sp. DM-2023]WOS39610.1 J domain-containing protein [Xanthomonas sp. DM-2023]WOS43794.1 J domain-containing protein [Xanthomonas sp. DM-2023]WOS47974.1 J domain-containing protein [Xanthomonas sp. DM-2023]WOS52153.1 J domain-containing protein [Xanthomonas sp. DM-2023]WOS56337.1 J domain-containing protein [Xanthomonas sp. DM-2023]